ncbi:PCYCGC motif-containing (lipo)protein, partial [Priestia megaterium]|uniref:PCYCGC motif-containing (lipo)protein n=3 Tax=Priestia TaxID=2800373 RepID=UPI00300BC1FD
ILATSIGLSACSNNTTTSSATNSSAHSGHEHHKAAVADIREETPGADVLPQFLKNQPKDMKLVYLSVAKNRELLEKIPCYCGC